MKIFEKKQADAQNAQPSPSLGSCVKAIPGRIKTAAGRHSSRHGAFSAGLTAIAVAATILFNLLAAQLPDSMKQFDMTGSGIYNITDTSIAVTEAMTQDVRILVLADKGDVDSRIVRFLGKYEELSDHLILEYEDPTIYPSLLNQYEAEKGDVVVICEATGRQEIFSLDDIIGFDMTSYYYYGEYIETDFDAEGLLTSAVDGVLNTASHLVYETTGHGETALSDTAVELLGKSHLEVSSVNLLTDGGIPADCGVLVLNAPTRDLADDELSAIREYLAAGGQVTYFMASDELSLPNFEALCAEYGMTVSPGYIMDSRNYYQNNPFLFFPTAASGTDVTSGIGTDLLLLMYMSRGMTITDPARDTITVNSFLNTSDSGYALISNAAQNQGVYSVGAVATETIDEETTARLTVFGSASPADEDLNSAFTNLDNLTLFVSGLTAGFDDVSAISIEAVSLSEPYNTVVASGMWSILFVLIIPAGVLLFGFVHWMRRRKL